MNPLPCELPDAQLELLLLAGARALRGSARTYCAEGPAAYAVTPEHRHQSLAALKACASELIRRDAYRLLQGRTLVNAEEVMDYLVKHLCGYEAEAFVVVFLDINIRVIAIEEMFRGTLAQTSVYPREIAKRALALNAGNVILAHNHPSGVATPSDADVRLTNTLKTVLQLLDVRVLDHIVVGADKALSMAQQGLM